MSYDRRIKITPPIILMPRKEYEYKRKTYIIIFFSPRCPHCKKIIECEKTEYGLTCNLRNDTIFYKAIEEAKKDPNLEIIIRLINVDTEEGSLEADESGVEYIPTIFINSNPIPIQYIGNYQLILDIIKGREPPSTTLSKYETNFLTYIGRRIRRWLR